MDDHTTHHDDCGCLTAWYEEKVGVRDVEIARLTAALSEAQSREAALKGEVAQSKKEATWYDLQAQRVMIERDAAVKRAEAWEEDARRYCQNADHHREKREAAERRLAAADRMADAADLVVTTYGLWVWVHRLKMAVAEYRKMSEK